MLTPPQALEALLFAAGEPLEKKEATKLLGVSALELEKVIDALSGQLSGRGVVLIESEHELELRTSAEAAEFVKKLRESELSRDLGKGSLETLAVIAYKGGATRGEIDWVRGVNSSASMRTLQLRGLIEGREDERDKRRQRYNLTTEALAHLGVSRGADLPRHSELSAGAQEIIKEESEALQNAAADAE
jgi:segregation and condensation protein B